MQHSLIVRIYRKDKKKQQGLTEIIHGTVENIYTAKTEAFSNKDELWRLINHDLEGESM